MKVSILISILMAGLLTGCCNSKDRFAVTEPLYSRRELMTKSWELGHGVIVRSLSLTNVTFQTDVFAVASYGKPDDGRIVCLEFYTLQWPEGPNREEGYLLVGRDLNGGYVKNIETSSVSGVPIFRITRRRATTETEYSLRYVRGRMEPDLTGNFVYDIQDLQNAPMSEK